MTWCSGDRRAEVLERELAAAAGAMHLASARLVDVLARVLAEGSWVQDGVRSPEHYVMWQCGVSRARAEGLVALAARRTDLPATAARFDAGELSEDHAASIARRCPSSHDVVVAEQAPRLTHPQLGRALRLLPPIVDPPAADAPAADAPPAPERRDMGFFHDDAGWLHGRFVLPPDEGAIVEQALTRHRQIAFDDAGNGTEEVTWADALVGMANASLEADPGSPRDRYVVNIHVDADSDAPTRIGLGPLLPTDLARLSTCDCNVRTFLREKGRIVAKGRTSRVVDPTLRAIIEGRDGGCMHPLCTAHRRLDIHHLWHWEDGGPTEPHNLLALCRRHHRALHRGEFTIEGDPEQRRSLVFRSRAGWVIEPRPPCPTVAVPPPPSGWSRPWGGPVRRTQLAWAAERPPPAALLMSL
jgi:hypothetical protein